MLPEPLGLSKVFYTFGSPEVRLRETALEIENLLDNGAGLSVVH